MLDQYQPRQTSKLYAADGRFIAELGLERRTLLKIDQIPPLVRNAFVMTEDKRFYQHAGIDWQRIPGAILADIRHRSFAEGFSTITMQLARNIFPERLIARRSRLRCRKLKEAKVARAIEAKYSKDKILELYLNQIPLGNGAYGVETAAQRYFGKSARDLNLAEAATLAGLPKAPERYNPRRSPERAIQRRNTVIELMREQGVDQRRRREPREGVSAPARARVEAGDVAPYFVEWIRQQLEQQFGQQLYEQGLKVYTTLDVDLQSAAERALENQLRAIEAGSSARTSTRSYERTWRRASERVGRAKRAATRRICRARSSRWIRAPAPCARWSAVATSTTPSSIARRRRFVSPARRSSRSSTPTPIQNGRPPSYIVDDSPVVGAAVGRRQPGRRRTTTESSRGRCRCAAASTSRATSSRSRSAWSSARRA